LGEKFCIVVILKKKFFLERKDIMLQYSLFKEKEKKACHQKRDIWDQFCQMTTPGCCR
jgi:hypothetical protein